MTIKDIDAVTLLDLIDKTFKSNRDNFSTFGYVFEKEAKRMGYDFPMITAYGVKSFDFRLFLGYMYDYAPHLRENILTLCENYNIDL